MKKFFGFLVGLAVCLTGNVALGATATSCYYHPTEMVCYYDSDLDTTDGRSELFSVTSTLFTSEVDLTCTGGAGALRFDAGDETIMIEDNDSESLVIESDDGTNLLAFSTTNSAEAATWSSGVVRGTVSVTGATTLDASDCGKTMFVTAGIDTLSITLPATVAGCELAFMYVGADGGALLDISPNAADAVHGSCTLAASVLEFNGTDDNDIGLTKATANTGDTITLIGDGTEGWYVTACAGIWANN